MTASCPVLDHLFCLHSKAIRWYWSTFRDNKTKAHKGYFVQSPIALDSKAHIFNSIAKPEHRKALF